MNTLLETALDKLTEGVCLIYGEKGEQHAGARSSADGRYRYLLTRQLGFGHGAVMFLMLNPWTADAVRNDRTIRRCINFGKAGGYGWLYVCNLSPFRSPDPRHVVAAGTEPSDVWRENFTTILTTARRCNLVVASYGWQADTLPGVYDFEPGARLNREALIIAALKADGHDVQCLGVTKEGHPKHPLYLKADTVPVPFAWPRRHGWKAL